MPTLEDALTDLAFPVPYVAPGGVGGSGKIDVAATRTALKAIVTTATPVVFLQENGREGLFEWDATVPAATHQTDTAEGLFVAPASGAAGAWVRRFNGPVNPEWFGMVPNASGSAGANVTAWNNMKAALRKIAVERDANYPGLAAIEFPNAIFYFNAPLDVDDGVMSVRGSVMERGTTLRWSVASTGLRIQYYDTSGGSGGSVSAHESSGHTVIERLQIEGIYYNAFAGVGVTEGEHHGIQMRAMAHLRDVTINGFPGDGIYVNAGALSPGFRGNANMFSLINVAARCCRNGLTTIGADSGAYNVFGGSFDNNRAFGHFEPEDSTLGGSFWGTHFDSNGDVSLSATVPATITKHSGLWYSCVYGQEAWASANAPTGTATDNQGWQYIGPTGSAAVVNWFNGINVRGGGSVLAKSANAQTAYWNTYSEPGLGHAQIHSPNAAYGGGIANNGGATNGLTGLRVNYNQGAYQLNRPTYVKSLKAELEVRVAPPTTGWGAVVVDGKDSDYANVQWQRNGAAQVTAQLFNGELFIDTASPTKGFKLRCGGAESFWLTYDGLYMAAGYAIRIGGNQVVGGRRPAIANPTDAASTQAKLIELLDAARAHGLIAS